MHGDTNADLEINHTFFENIQRGRRIFTQIESSIKILEMEV